MQISLSGGFGYYILHGFFSFFYIQKRVEVKTRGICWSKKHQPWMWKEGWGAAWDTKWQQLSCLEIHKKVCLHRTNTIFFNRGNNTIWNKKGVKIVEIILIRLYVRVYIHIFETNSTYVYIFLATVVFLLGIWEN